MVRIFFRVKSKKTNDFWQLEPPINNSTKGLWTSSDGKKLLPISLILVSEENNKSACGSDSYNLKLESFPKVNFGEIKSFKGKKYRQLKVADVVTLELLETGDGITKINQQLRKILPKNISDLKDYFDTRRRYLGEHGRLETDETDSYVQFWKANYITITDYRWVAVMGRNGINSLNTTWDTETGNVVDMHSWFNMKKLNKLVDKSVCGLEEYRGKNSWKLSLEDSGISYGEDAFGEGCERFLNLKYSQLNSILTKSGKLAFKSIINNN